MNETEVFQDGRKDQDPRKVGVLQILEKARKWVLPWSLQKEYNTADILISAHMIHCTVVTFRTAGS